MNRLKKVISIVLTCATLLGTVLSGTLFKTAAASVTTLYIDGTNVNIRTEPSTSSSIITKLSNTSATVLETVKKGNEVWYKINHSSGIVGYVFYNSKYIRVVTYNPDASFEEKLNAFPETYKSALRSLHAAYPNWEFIPDPVTVTFEEAVYQESLNLRKQVSFSSSAVSWRSMGQGSYDWSKGEWVVTNGGWTGASKEIIAYYMDPRNFLNSSAIYQFLIQSYNPQTQNEAGLKKIISGSFLEKGYTADSGDEYGGSYVKIIMAAAASANVSPYIIAAKIIQEQGASGNSSLISGTYSGFEGYYNFFNIGASGKDNTEVVKNGLTRAKNENWSSRAASIIGGAKFLSNNYISAGQDTYYYQDFNVHNTGSLWHQYAQAVHDAYNKGVALKDTYKNLTDLALNFKIPVYSVMSSTVSAKPVSNSKKNNYYATSVTASGACSSLTPTFSMFNYEYDLHLTGDTTVYLKPVNGAVYSGNASYKISKGSNSVSLAIKAETGYVNNYTIKIDSTVNCVLYIKTGSAPVSTVMRGDTNGDGKISLSDLANVRLHLLKKYTLTGDRLTAADTNRDGKVTLSDLANIRLHLLGLYTIS